MIELKFNDKAIMGTLHAALVGSPAYITSEIAIVEGDNDDFYLVVGNENDHDCTVEIDSYVYN